jgi:hypothetical protein
VYSLTGATADHRLRLESRQIVPFLAALAAEAGLNEAWSGQLAIVATELGTNLVKHGGGGEVLLPWNIYVEIGAWQFKDNGERVFVTTNNEVSKLGIPVEITVTPLEVTAGYRFNQVGRRIIPYAGVGYSSYRYKETSEGADPAENVDDRFTGFHLQGGVEYQPFRWLAVGGELGWASIADALGEGGVSKHYNEDNLGGSSFRLKISVGR